MKEYIIQNILSNKRIIKVFLFCILLGLASGIFCFNFIDKDIVNEIVTSFKNTINLSKQDNFESVKIVNNGFQNVIFLNVMLFITTFIFFAPIIICTIYFLKGFSIGILIHVIFNIFNFKEAILTSILIVVIPNFIFLVSMIYNGIKCVDCYYEMTEKFDKKDFLKSIGKLLFSFSLSLPFYFLSIVFEQLFFPIVINIYN